MERCNLNHNSSLYLLKIFVFVELISLVSSLYFFRVTPGGEGNSRPAYIYGGPMDPFDEGKQSSLYEYTFDDINTVNVDNYLPQRMTKDPASNYFLAEFKSKSDGNLLVARGDLCSASGSMKLATQVANIQLTDGTNKYLIDENCGDKCGWNAFTLYNGAIYFILSGVMGQYAADLRREVQLRKLDGCGSKLRTASIGSGQVDFQILSCSSLVATLYSEYYAWPNPDIQSWAAGSLLATDINNDGQPEFFTQLVQLNGNQVNMKLIKIQLFKSKDTTVTTLHTTPIDDNYGGNWNFPSLGEITFTSGTLCWTAAEQIICSLVEHNLDADSITITDFKVLLESGEAYSAGICSGQLSPLPYGRVITGVAIANTADPLTVYFGCYSDKQTVGGTGIVRLSSIGSKQISAVTNDNTKLLSGGVLVTKHYGTDCPAAGDITESPCNEVSYSSKATEGRQPLDMQTTAVDPQPVRGHSVTTAAQFTTIVLCVAITCLTRLLQ